MDRCVQGLCLQEICAHPSSIADGHTVEEDKPDDEDQDDNGRGTNTFLRELKSIRVNRDEAESDCDSQKTSRHSPNGGHEDATTTEWIDGHHVDPGHHEVRSSDDKADGDRVRESDQCEESAAVVHERVEAAHLRDDHETASADQCAEVGRVGVQRLDLGPPGLALVELLALLAGRRDQRDLRPHLLNRGALVDLHQDLLGFFKLAVVDQLARRLGAEGEHAGKDDRGNGT